MTKHVADRRDAILDYISEYSRKNGFSPSIREMAEACGLASTSAVHFHLQEAVRDGDLEYQRGRMRTWRVTPRGGR